MWKEVTAEQSFCRVFSLHLAPVRGLS